MSYSSCFFFFFAVRPTLSADGDKNGLGSFLRLDQAVEEIKAVTIRTKFMPVPRRMVILSQLFHQQVSGRVIDADDACFRSTTDALDCHDLVAKEA